jgi:hypoxanthine phosphoribosyltransferase
MQRRTELITWGEVEKLIDHLTPQFQIDFEAMVIITRGGIIPGGMLCEALNIESVLTAAVDFPFGSKIDTAKLLAWPKFIQFPEDNQIEDRKLLVVDDVWGSGRTITAVRSRIVAAKGVPLTCVLHYNPYRNLFGQLRPDYFAASTDAHIVYPWEVDQGPDRVLLDEPE